MLLSAWNDEEYRLQYVHVVARYRTIVSKRRSREAPNRADITTD